MIKDLTKPDKNVECPPFDIRYEFPPMFKCMFKHKFEWKITPMKQYRQEICKECGITGKSEKL